VISCDNVCDKYGLRYEAGPVDAEGIAGKTFSTKDYAVSLALNMLMTDGILPDTSCGYRPGGRGGHWSDSFREDNLTTGSLLRTLKPGKSIAGDVALIGTYANHDMQKLVSLGVAASVTATAKYAGNGKIELAIEIFGQMGQKTRVGLTGTPIKNAWVWG
jgi:phage gp46-like protein